VIESPSASVYTVEQADLSRDRDTILDIWSRNLRAHSPEEHKARFQWHYMENPVPGSRLFLARQGATGKVIGTAGLGMRQVWADNQLVNAGIAIDFSVEPEHRTLQPAVLLARAVTSSIDSGVDFVFSLPNDKARPVFKRIGYVQVAALRRFVKVLDTGEFLRRRPLPGIVRGPLALGGNMAQSAMDLMRTGFQRDYEIAQIEWSDGRLEPLWRSVSSQPNIIGDRRPEYLEWRFGRCPLHRHQLLGLTRRDNDELLGYAAVYPGDKGQLKVPDLLISPDCEAVAALMALSRWAKRNDFASIAFEIITSSGPLSHALKQAGFRDRGDTDVLFVMDKRNERPAKNKPWYFLRADEFYNTF
jgi:hypothetical protein